MEKTLVGGITMKKQNDQQELFQTEVSWFHMFKEMIRSKTWAKMSPVSKSLYPTIKSFSNWQTGSTFPSIDTLEEYSGLSRPSVMKGLKELEDLGYIRSKKTPGRPTLYTLIEKFDIKDGEGIPVASASFDYLPSLLGDAMVELKNYVAKGMTGDGQLQLIHVDRFVIENLTVVSGHDNIGTQNNNNIDIGALFQGIQDRMEGKITEAAIYADAVEAEGVKKKG